MMKQDWGLPDKKRGTLIWISSPSLDKSGMQRVNVFYQLENGEYHHAWLNWSQLHYLNLGYQYENLQKPIVPEKSVVGTLTNEDIRSISIEDCRNINSDLISFSNFKKASNISKNENPDIYVKNALNEKCLIVRNPDSVIYIPCIIALKGLYGAYRGLVNPILHERELETYFEDDNIIPPTGLKVKLTSFVPKELITNDALRYLLWLRFTTCIYDEYNKTCKEFKACKKITTCIPPNIEQNISFSGIQHINALNIKHILVQSLQINGLSLPYRPITVILPSTETTINDSENKRYIQNAKESKETINETSTFAGSDNGTTDEMDYSPYTFSEAFIVNKIRSPRKGLSKFRLKPNEKNDLRFTTNESGSGFSAKPVGIKYSDASEVDIKPLSIIEGLNDFCLAMNLLKKHPNIINVDIISGEFNGIKEYCINGNGTVRKYALANIFLSSGKQVYIFEAQKNRLPLSTLIIYNPRQDYQITACQVKSILDKKNGSFNTSYLKEYFDKDYRLVQHYTGRKPHDWAELLWTQLK